MISASVRSDNASCARMAPESARRRRTGRFLEANEERGGRGGDDIWYWLERCVAVCGVGVWGKIDILKTSVIQHN